MYDSKNPRFFSCIQDGTLHKLAYSGEKKNYFKHLFNIQEDVVWSRDGNEGSHFVTRKRCAASVVICPALTEVGKSPLTFVDQGIKFNKQI